MLTPREQGDFGERAALYWLVAQGAHVSIPFGHNSHYDLIADFDGQPLRVQVKTAACRQKERWAVTVCTRGGNQSWNGLVKRLDLDRFDRLFVVVGDGRQWFIPADRGASFSAGPNTRNSRSNEATRFRAARSKKASLESPPDCSGGCPSG